MAKTVDRDEEHLRLLGIGHKVLAALMGIFACFPIIHLIMGIAMAAGGFDGGSNPPPPFLGYMLIAMALLMITLGWSLAIANWVVGNRIAERRSSTLCQVVAGIDCLWIPFGTALGVTSLIVLNRPSVRAEFDSSERPGVTARRKAGAKRCPYCHDSLSAEAAVACTACLAPHHEDCWDETGRCANCGAGERYAHVERTVADKTGSVRPGPLKE
jgi:hypothetical protein